jgi:hypothetical protein
MITPIRKTPLGPGRLKDESFRAYRGYCEYRDFGPERSLDRAWERCCARSEKGQVGKSARRPGHWAAWCQKYNWVERAEAHDDLMDEERRIAEVERRREFREDRSRFEREDLERKVKQVLNMDSSLDTMAQAPHREVTVVKEDKVSGLKTTNKNRPERDYSANSRRGHQRSSKSRTGKRCAAGRPRCLGKVPQTASGAQGT